MRVPVCFGELAAFEDVDLGGGDAAAVDGFDLEARRRVERGGGVVQDAAGTPASRRAPRNMSPEMPAKQSR